MTCPQEEKLAKANRERRRVENELEEQTDAVSVLMHALMSFLIFDFVLFLSFLPTSVSLYFFAHSLCMQASTLQAEVAKLRGVLQKIRLENIDDDVIDTFPLISSCSTSFILFLFDPMFPSLTSVPALF